MYTNALIKKGSLLMQRGDQEIALEQFDKAVKVGSFALVLFKQIYRSRTRAMRTRSSIAASCS